MGCRDDASSSRGESNLGNYCNKALDALTDQILFEVDPTTRNRLIKEAYQIAMDDYGFIPLHQQSLAWGVAKTLQVALRADNSVVLYWIRKN
jgi:peptide/nickel transport system substrate-binding protein